MERHDATSGNELVEQLARVLDAEIFKVAPFDLLTADGKVFEVKRCQGKVLKFKLSNEELNNARKRKG